MLTAAGQMFEIESVEVNGVSTPVWKSAPPAMDIHPDYTATLFYTSGTTGHPKGTRVSIAILLVDGAIKKSYSVRQMTLWTRKYR